MARSILVSAALLVALAGPPALAAGGAGASGAQAVVAARAWSDGSCEGRRHLAGLDGRNADTLLAELGEPTRRDEFRLAERRDAFHALLLEAYPPEAAGSGAVEVREWTFAAGACRLTLWLRRQGGGWESFENIRYPAEAVF